MRLFTLFEDDQGVLIPYDRITGSYRTIARQIVAAAEQEVGGSPRETMAKVDEMKERFIQQLTLAIQDEYENRAYKGTRRVKSFD